MSADIEDSLRISLPLSPILRLDNGPHSPACRKFPCDLRVLGPACTDDVSQNLVDRILIKDPKRPVGLDVHLQRFKLHAKLVGTIVDRDRSEVWKPRLGTHRCVFGVADADVIVWKLVWPALDCG